MAAPKGRPTPPLAPVVGPRAFASPAYLAFFNALVDFITNAQQTGDFADRPAADTVYPGTIYWSQDTNVAYISNGSTWVLLLTGGGAVDVDPAGALAGDGTVGSPLAVRVDGVSITINGSNDLEAATQVPTVLTVLAADPGAPANGTAWLFKDGSTPANISLRVRDGGVTYDLPIGTLT